MSPLPTASRAAERRRDDVPMPNNMSDRRRSARVAVQGEVQGHLARLDELVTIREMSLQGMSIESATRFEPGAITDIRLTLGDGASVQVTGTVIYTRPLQGAATPVYVSGIQFNDPEE